MATLDEVARLAGVTAATVSNVITGRVRVREETRERVLSAIAAVGYHPNLVARGLARGKTFTIALLVPSIANPFFSEVIEEIESLADAQDYQILLALSHGDSDHGAHHLKRLASRWVDCFIIMGGAAPTADVLELAKMGKPVILSVWDMESEEITLPSVDIDFRSAGEMATRHLIAQGHQRIATILELPVQRTRFEGYQLALSRAGLTVPENYIRHGESSFESGLQQMQALLALPTPPTALFAGNDMMAIGALETLYHAGVRVPSEFAVIGVDDVLQAEYTHPPLTTIRIPKRELAREAIELALTHIAGEAAPTHRLLSPTLIRRQSA